MSIILENEKMDKRFIAIAYPVTLNDSEGSKFFAEFTLSIMRLLRFARNDRKRRAQNDTQVAKQPMYSGRNHKQDIEFRLKKNVEFILTLITFVIQTGFSLSWQYHISVSLRGMKSRNNLREVEEIATLCSQ